LDDVAFKALISGQRRGVISALQRGGLSALSLFYGLAVRLRNRGFELGWKKTFHAAVPVISVGNITTGGTGKTPLVAWLANWFRGRGVNVALLSRGYRSLAAPGGDASGSPVTPGADASGSPVNDEKLVLDRLCPGVPHVQQPDRVAGAESAVEQHGAELLILDDGFQHRRLQRDLDIVLIDALNPFGYGRLLPRGLLREPLSGLRRADAIVLTRADQCAAEEKASILETLHRFAPECDVVEAAFRPSGLINSTGDTAALTSLDGVPVVAFCGIGNPESFRRTLAGCEVREFRAFPDHHHYTASDMELLAQSATRHEAREFVTTLKDLVKINAAEIGGRPVRAMQISAEILNNGERLEAHLGRFVSGARRSLRISGSGNEPRPSGSGHGG